MRQISFARGVPAPECLPVEELADCARAAVERDGRTILSYGAGAGYEPLRQWIGERHGVPASRVLLTNGSLQGFGFLARHFAGRGRVLVEAPTYDRPLTILSELGIDVTAIPQDDDGLELHALERELRDGPEASFLYTIPTFQNPSGRTLSAERRRRISEIAAEHDLPVLEDDPYGLVRYEGEPPPTLHELAGGDLVTYTSSFSKTVAPGLRTGYFVLPAGEAAAFEERAVSTYISPPFLTQATIWEFVQRDLFEPNLSRVRAELRARRDAMLTALARTFPDDASWSRPEGGYFLWLELGEGRSASELSARAAEEGVAFVQGEGFFPPGFGRGVSSARLAFSYETPERISEGIERLSALL